MAELQSISNLWVIYDSFSETLLVVLSAVLIMKLITVVDSLLYNTTRYRYYESSLIKSPWQECRTNTGTDGKGCRALTWPISTSILLLTVHNLHLAYPITNSESDWLNLRIKHISTWLQHRIQLCIQQIGKKYM